MEYCPNCTKNLLSNLLNLVSSKSYKISKMFMTIITKVHNNDLSLQPVQQNINNLHKVYMNIIFVYKSYFSHVTLSHIHHTFMISSNPKFKYISMKDYYVEACQVPINQNCLVHNTGLHTHTHKRTLCLSNINIQ